MNVPRAMPLCWASLQRKDLLQKACVTDPELVASLLLALDVLLADGLAVANGCVSGGSE